MATVRNTGGEVVSAIDWEATSLEVFGKSDGHTFNLDDLPDPEALCDDWRTLALAEREGDRCYTCGGTVTGDEGEYTCAECGTTWART